MIYLGTEIENTLESSQSINKSISMSIPTSQKALAWNIINWSDLDMDLLTDISLCLSKNIPRLYLTTELQLASFLTSDIATLLALHPLLSKHNRNLGHAQHLWLLLYLSIEIPNKYINHHQQQTAILAFFLPQPSSLFFWKSMSNA